MTVPRTAVIFSTDEAFAPLAKGLVLSILSQIEAGEFDLKLVDIGCSTETLTWMKQRGVEVRKFDRKMHSRLSGSGSNSYQDAQFCRPFLPRLFPDYEVYIWCDSDIWIQDISSIRLYRNLADEYKQKVIISPLVDTSYSHTYVDFSEFSRYSNIWFSECYGATMASTYSNRAVFSSGLFSMHRDCKIWKLWEKEIEHISRRSFSSQKVAHLGEQTALNLLLYSYESFISISAEYNYNCHLGSLVRNAADRVVIDSPPFREIGVVHLTYSSKMMPSYLENNILYDSGNYLDEGEKSSLLKLSHY
jgi:lipopolysaccharide biosynthesis glycosyltransferase